MIGGGFVTEEAFLQLCEHLSNHLWLQSLLVVAGTCFLEDAARCGVGILVASGHIGWWLALASMTAGGMAGDIGLYLIGRYATSFLVRQRWVDLSRLTWMEDYFKNHAIKTVLFSRFLPGARTIAFSAAGIIRYPFVRFLFLLFLAAFIQALLFLQLGSLIGEKLLPYLSDPIMRTGIVAMILLLGTLLHLVITRTRRQRLAKAANTSEPAG